MSIKRLLNAVECGGDIGRRVAALVLPISNRSRVTSSCARKVGLREPGEHTSGSNLASRNNVAHSLTILEAPPSDSSSKIAHLALIGMSAHAVESEREKAIATGCDEFDAKPIEFESLVATIRRVLAPHK
jgi:hypothetical protein